MITEAPAKAPEAPKAPAKAGEAPVKAAPEKEAPVKKAPAKAEKKAEPKPKKAEAKGDQPAPPADRKALEALVKAEGVEAALGALSKVKVVDLRALAREYNGEFGIAGREIRNANKKVLIEEFRRFFAK